MSFRLFSPVQVLLASFLGIGLLSFIPLSLIADEGRGRLPDGRAFRTDQEGNQIVDYIAELEASVDSLNRRVVGLEAELQDKQHVLDRVSRGGSAGSTLTEKTLAGDSGAGSACPAVRCPVKDCTNEVRTAEATLRSSISNDAGALEEVRGRCAQDVAALSATVTALRGDVARKNAALQGFERQVVAATQESSAASGLLSEKTEQLAQLRAELEQASQEQSDVESHVAQKRDSLGVLRDELRSIESEVGSLEKIVVSLKERRALLQTQRAALERVVQESEKSIAAARTSEYVSQGSYRAEAISAPAVAEFVPRDTVTDSARGGLSLSRVRAMESVKGSISTSINQIQGLIVTRDRMYQEYSAQPSTVGFRPSAAVSSRGLSIGGIRERLGSATTTREFSELSRAVNEIRSRIESDIALMKRVKRLG